jgi:hypothetical protein
MACAPRLRQDARGLSVRGHRRADRPSSPDGDASSPNLSYGPLAIGGGPGRHYFTDRDDTSGPDGTLPASGRPRPMTGGAHPDRIEDPDALSQTMPRTGLTNKERNYDALATPHGGDNVTARPIGGSGTTRPRGTRGPVPPPGFEPDETSSARCLCRRHRDETDRTCATIATPIARVNKPQATKC